MAIEGSVTRRSEYRTLGGLPGYLPARSTLRSIAPPEGPKPSKILHSKMVVRFSHTTNEPGFHRCSWGDEFLDAPLAGTPPSAQVEIPKMRKIIETTPINVTERSSGLTVVIAGK
ncbi:hypothetical protein C8F04DRAFT_1177078 [Mycena alexandri]|uniref:Uncharacterized protein n=1 Tax=Mycena alexandri TaxID=1745969 RepID=A0AAD6T922_9AGAR|nr:hypothetical protein C8F04DRAFT_1177078 [Mycena alexandri]